MVYMLKTLHSRLLLSFVAVILTALLLVAITLFFFATRPEVRNLSTLDRLLAVGVSSTNELLRLRDAQASEPELEQVLEQTAVSNGVRVFIIDILTQEVVYDTNPSPNWVGQLASRLERSNRVLLNAPLDSLLGIYIHPQNGRWLVYGSPLVNGRFRIFYAQPEPTALQFFNSVFLQPLAGAGIVALMLSISLAYGIAGSVAHPLQQLANAAEEVAQGHYEQQLDPAGPEEVQRVAASFNSMAAQVNATHKAQREFVANVSHDLKTPLTSISGWSQALLDGTAVSPDEQQQAATIIYQETERMHRMVNQLLDLARLESGQLRLVHQPVDLSQLMQDVHRNLLRRAQDQQIHLTLDAPSLPPISGDYDRLMQVFSNLVDNALAHTPAGGRVHLATKQADEKAVEAVVQDSGNGIPPEDLPHIFERFYQVDKSRAQENGRRGAGLGLAIVQEIVEAHKGVVQAQSQMGKGTVFVVRLPISQALEASTIVRKQ